MEKAKKIDNGFNKILSKIKTDRKEEERNIGQEQRNIKEGFYCYARFLTDIVDGKGRD